MYTYIVVNGPLFQALDQTFFSLSPFLQGLLVHSTFVMHNTSKQLTVQAVINDPKQLQALTFAIRSFQPISCTYHLSVTLDHNIIHISITYGAGRGSIRKPAFASHRVVPVINLCTDYSFMHTQLHPSDNTVGLLIEDTSEIIMDTSLIRTV